MTETRLFKDESFHNGFTVYAIDHRSGIRGNWTFPESDGAPVWRIDPWYSRFDLWCDRVESDVYTLSDGRSKTVRYDPANGAILLRLNAAGVYGGRAAGNELWPHLLLEQEPLTAETDGDFKRFRADAQSVRMEIDLRMTDYRPTTNPAGINACQFMAYFYLRHRFSERFIWFGVNFFDSRGLTEPYWHLDTVGTEMIYLLSTEQTFGSKENSFQPDGNVHVSTAWKHLSLELTPYIEHVLALARRDGVFAHDVKKEDFYFRGVNIGFETHGNIDCAMEFKRFNLITCR